jgi:HEAT repeat protein
VLIKAFQDDRAEVRIAAATSLAEAWRLAGKGRSGTERSAAGPGGARRSDSPSAPSANKLLAAYEPLAKQAVPLLTAALRDGDARIRAHAAEALAETGPLAEPAVPDLANVLDKDSDPEARLQATVALANVGPAAKAAVPVLVDKLRHDKAFGVRVTAAFALGLIHSSPQIVVPALVETVLKDEDPDARRAAMRGLGLFGPEAKIAIPLLQEAAKDPKNQQSKERMQNIDRLLSFIGRQAPGSPKDRPGQIRPAPQRPPGR